MRNEVDGSIYGPLVQARDITGDVHFHRTVSLPPPNQLLPRPRLINRDSVIAELDALRAHDTDTPVTALITGSAGVGKTTLSLSWAHMVRPHYPDGQLYADLGGHAGDEPVSPHTVLGDFLHALGIPAELIPGEFARRAALYRTVTHDRRLFVLLDDAVTAAQVRPLLPASPRSVTLVTSRHRLAGLLAGGAHGVQVDHLDADAGLALLVDVLGEDRVAREPQAAVELVELCVRLPLALRVAAARLAARPNWPLAEMVAALSEEQRRLAALTIGDDMALRASLDLSYRALPPGAARLYRLLSVVPGNTFGGDAVAALAGIPGWEARRLLELLTEANLLTDTAEARYRFHHALIRLHASQEAEAEDPEEVRDGAVQRLLGWYLATAAKAERRIRPHRTGLPRDAESPPAEPTDFGGPEDALAWLAAEHANLGAAVTAAYEHGRPATAWQLADAMWPLLLHLGHRQAERLAVEEIGVAAARACGDRHAEAKMLNRLGLSLHDLGRFDDATAHFEQARALWEALGERGRSAGSLRRLGWVAATRGEHDTAIGHFLAAAAVYRELGAGRKVALVLTELANVLIAQGRGSDAIHHAEQARTLLDGVDDRYNQGRAQIALGRAHMAKEDRDAATQELRAALETLTELGSATGRAEALTALGELAEHAERHDTARRRYEEALAALGEGDTAAHTRLRLHLNRLDRGEGVS
ncbi:tetratricopeptide repeat protein [Microtetraspora sp. NBRC 13810]|uniref:tetratricopeptide repeat protein n=1 Tax=Microtetraspora sp. NBRC 13810 TaxID=3030990 RepID=UPI00255552DB|nr:tetratricopeptide repeat protein [Microtetraspora sp. NBRC 13810]